MSDAKRKKDASFMMFLLIGKCRISCNPFPIKKESGKSLANRRFVPFLPNQKRPGESKRGRMKFFFRIFVSCNLPN